MKRSQLDHHKIDLLIKELTVMSDQRTLAVWAADCARRVLPCFENQFPEDNRPRMAIEAVNDWLCGKIKIPEVRKIALAAHAAARSAGNIPEACFAARAAGQALGTAHVAGHAVHASRYAIKAIRAVSSLAEVDINADTEQHWQYQHLLNLKKSL